MQRASTPPQRGDLEHAERTFGWRPLASLIDVLQARRDPVRALSYPFRPPAYHITENGDAQIADFPAWKPAQTEVVASPPLRRDRRE